MYACSSEGHIAVMHFELAELGPAAPDGARESFLDTWKFRRPPRQGGLYGGESNGGGGGYDVGEGGAAGTALRPNQLMARKGKVARESSSSALLPIPPPGAAQSITLTKDGKRRIRPAFLGLGGIVAQPLASAALRIAEQGERREAVASTSSSAAKGATSAAVFQPALVPAVQNGDVDMVDRVMEARMQASTSSASVYQHKQQQRTSLQDVGLPSWGAPQERAVQHAQQHHQHARKRKAMDLDGDEQDRNDMEPLVLAPQRPPGRTLGGDRQMQPYEGDLVELRPPYVPKTVVHIPSEAMELAVPAVKAFACLKWDADDQDAEKLEIRNYASSLSGLHTLNHDGMYEV